MFQGVFGMIFTVIIALEFKRSLLIITERADSVVQVRTVVLLAMLAILRKLIILDLGETQATQIFALAAAILALGAVYWFVRDQDRRDVARRTSRADSASWPAGRRAGCAWRSGWPCVGRAGASRKRSRDGRVVSSARPIRFGGFAAVASSSSAWSSPGWPASG